MARPTKLTPKIMKIAREYPEKFPEHEHAIPSAIGLAKVLNVARSTIYKWAEENEKFSDILEDVNSTQEMVLIQRGLLGEFNSNITKLVLGKHGFHDKQEHGGMDGEELVLKVKHV